MTIAEGERINKIPFVFIMGKERSGTTLLQAMFNAHPNITAPHESRIIIFMYARYGKVEKWTKQLLEKFCDELYYETRFSQRWHIDKQKLLDELNSIVDVLTYGLIFKVIYCMTAPDKEIKVIFDKNPVYYFFLSELKDIFPDAKYIHIVRDYRDNTVSHQAVWPGESAESIAYRWVIVNGYIEDEKRRNYGKWYTVKYEELVVEPMKYMKEMCLYIQLPFDEEMVTSFPNKLSHVFYENAGKKNFSKFHGNVYNPINTKPVGQYIEKMSFKDVALVESIAGPLGKQYAYELTLPYKRPGRLVVLKAKYRFAVFKLLQRVLYKHYVVYRISRYYFNGFGKI